MKTLTTLLLASLLSSQASASFYQKTCTSANGLTRTAHGHVEFYTIVTEVKYGEDRKRTEIPINIDYENFDTEITESKTISEENNSHCDPEHRSGFASWKTVSVEKIVITKKNGSLFPAGVSGVSADRTQVTADLICEDEGNSQIFCD